MTSANFASHLNIKPRCTVALDCDGVILDFLSHFKTIAKYALGREMIDHSNVYDLGVRFGLTPDERARVMHVFDQEGGWGNLPDLDGAIEGARELQDAGHRVIVVTAIDEKYRQARLFNFASLGFNPDAMYCVGTQAGHTKSDAYRLEQPHAIVDDRLVYLKEAANTIKYHTPELVWINDGVCQNGHESKFVHHEVVALSHWADPILSKQPTLTVQKKLKLHR